MVAITVRRNGGNWETMHNENYMPDLKMITVGNDELIVTPRYVRKWLWSIIWSALAAAVPVTSLALIWEQKPYPVAILPAICTAALIRYAIIEFRGNTKKKIRQDATRIYVNNRRLRRSELLCVCIKWANGGASEPFYRIFLEFRGRTFFNKSIDLLECHVSDKPQKLAETIADFLDTHVVDYTRWDELL